jgi:hypothetical protein
MGSSKSQKTQHKLKESLYILDVTDAKSSGLETAKVSEFLEYKLPDSINYILVSYT